MPFSLTSTEGRSGLIWNVASNSVCTGKCSSARARLQGSGDQFSLPRQTRPSQVVVPHLSPVQGQGHSSPFAGASVWLCASQLPEPRPPPASRTHTLLNSLIHQLLPSIYYVPHTVPRNKTDKALLWGGRHPNKKTVNKEERQTTHQRTVSTRKTCRTVPGKTMTGEG